MTVKDIEYSNAFETVFSDTQKEVTFESISRLNGKIIISFRDLLTNSSLAVLFSDFSLSAVIKRIVSHRQEFHPLNTEKYF